MDSSAMASITPMPPMDSMSSTNHVVMVPMRPPSDVSHMGAVVARA